MVVSRSVLGWMAGFACGLTACDALIGLGAYARGGSCPGCDGGPDAAGDGGVADGRAPGDASARDGAEAGDASGAVAPGIGDAAPGDGAPGIPPPTVHEVWVHWPMPNPDAAIAVGSDAALPHPMAYAVEDGGARVLDIVTGLTWESGPGTMAKDYASAAAYCTGLPAPPGSAVPWRVPTRIELVSLVDFTRLPTLDDEAFAIDAGTALGAFWSASAVPNLPGVDAAVLYWIVSFADGSVTYGTAAGWVRCVHGGVQ